MKHIKNFKLFESNKNRKEIIINKVINSNIGDILPESDIYQYVEVLHDNYDFTEGNLAKRIEHYPKYKLTEVNLNDIDLDEFDLDEDLMDEYIEIFEESGEYPPIILAHDLRIIDGNHRANALYNIGHGKIKAFIGIGNTDIFDEYDEYDD